MLKHMACQWGRKRTTTDSNGRERTTTDARVLHGESAARPSGPRALPAKKLPLEFAKGEGHPRRAQRGRCPDSSLALFSSSGSQGQSRGAVAVLCLSGDWWSLPMCLPLLGPAPPVSNAGVLFCAVVPAGLATLARRAREKSFGTSRAPRKETAGGICKLWRGAGPERSEGKHPGSSTPRLFLPFLHLLHPLQKMHFLVDFLRGLRYICGQPQAFPVRVFPTRSVLR